MSSITILYDEKHLQTEIDSAVNLLNLLLEQGIPIHAPCGGNGRCGKCLVSLTRNGQTKDVLACHTTVNYDCVVNVPKTSLLQSGITDHESISARQTLSHGYVSAAVDLGTTTVAVALLSEDSGETIGVEKEWNQQISFGADVISRTKYIMEQEHGLEKLSSLIQNQIYQMITRLCKQSGISMKAIKNVCISGNTIMQHIFAELDPTGITLAPYIPKTLFDETKVWHFPSMPNMDVYLIPCISGYVGGDITSGLYSSGLYKKDGTYLFLDIGTNGEMAIGGKDGFTCCSVASGPAFEGAEITCGMTSIPGAVCHLDWQETICKFQTEVIGQTMATGFCGSGLIDLLAILLKTGILDETGRLLSPEDAKKEIPRITMARLKNSLGYNFLERDENGNGIFYLKRNPSVYLTISDVRKLQLAKAAIAAGIEMLLKETGKTYDDIDGLYLAGGLGESLNADNAALIGMIPMALKDRITCIGNSSLAGAKNLLQNHCDLEPYISITRSCSYIELAGNPDFNTAFINQMTFEQ
jgi:uncharacterized 2Fe-2S/4Fe-4S cluster protein (DUF4445 family)